MSRTPLYIGAILIITGIAISFIIPTFIDMQTAYSFDPTEQWCSTYNTIIEPPYISISKVVGLIALSIGSSLVIYHTLTRYTISIEEKP